MPNKLRSPTHVHQDTCDLPPGSLSGLISFGPPPLLTLLQFGLGFFSRTLAQVWPHSCFLLKSWLPDIRRAFSLTLPRNKRRPSLTRPIEKNICLELPFTISLFWFILHIEFIPMAHVLYLFVCCLFLTSTKNISYKKEVLSVLFSH